jgi:hypothetical protein
MEYIISKIRTQYINSGIVRMDDEISEFQKKQPKLYNMITSKDCDETMLNKLIETYSKLQKGNVTQSKADKLFGETAAEQYVYPLIKK